MTLRTSRASLAILGAVILVSLIARIRLIGAPLERDEGEHAYLARLILEGHVPWSVAYNLKLPGTDAAYALIMAIFGQTAAAIRLGLLLMNTATILLVMVLGTRLFGSEAGAAAGACYGLLSLGQNVVGTIAHATHFVVFFAMIATILLLRAGTGLRWLFLSGLTYGLAFLMKQPGIAFAGFGALYLVWRFRLDRTGIVRGMRGLATFGFGVALPYGTLCLWLWRAGVFGRFWFWTVTLAAAHTAEFPLKTAYRNFLITIPDVLNPTQPLWVLAALGLLLSLWNPATRRAGLFTGAFLVFSFLAVAAGAAFNPNYFILMLPAVALSAGAFVPAARQLLKRIDFPPQLPMLCFVLALLYSVVEQRTYLFRMNPYEFERDTYGLNPFPEAVKVADYIRTHSESGARVAVLGSEAEIYFYSQRRAATGYLFTYSLMEINRWADSLQGEMISEISASRPEYVVFVPIPGSWMANPSSSTAILSWFSEYAYANYDRVGVVDLAGKGPARYIWEPAAATYRYSDPSLVMLIFRRKLQQVQ